MKIFNAVLGDATGGRWRVVMDYCELLAALGHEFVLITNPATEGPLSEFVSRHTTRAHLRSSGHYDVWGMMSAAALIRKHRPDIIICHCSRSIAMFRVAARGQIPIVGVAHSPKVKRIIKADVFFNISHEISEMMRACGVAEARMYHMPNMVRSPQDATFVVSQPRVPPVIGAAARFVPQKGLSVYLDALALLTLRGLHFRALLGGDGELRAELVAQIQRLGLQDRVTMTGWVKDMPAFLEQVDLFCMPSLSEAFPVTTLEVFLSSTPIVVTDVPGVLDAARHEVNACVAKRNDPQSLADQMEDCLRDWPAALRRARQGFDDVLTHYSTQAMLARMDQALADIFGQASVSRRKPA